MMSWLLWFLLWYDPTDGGGTVEGIGLPRLGTPALAALFIALLVGGIWLIRWCYRNDAEFVTPQRKRLLAGARGLALVVVLFIATGAFLRLGTTFDGKGTVMFVVDHSASMALVDKGSATKESRQQLLTKAFADPAKDPVAALADRFKAEGYTFGKSPGLTALELGAGGAAGPLAKLTPADEPASQLGAALADSARRGRGRRVDAVVLLTDGGWNRGEDPVGAAASLGVPVIAVGVGDPQSKDLEIPYLSCDDVVFKNDRFPLDVRIRQRGFDGRAVLLTVRRTGENGVEEVVKEETVTLGADREFVRTVELSPDKEGVFTYSVELAHQVEEANVINNRKARSNIRVVDKKLRVLAVDDAPRWEFRFLRGILESDKQRMAPTLFLAQADRNADKRGIRFIQRFPGTAKALAEYDCIVLGDTPPEMYTSEDFKALEEWIRKEGGGLIIVAGRRHMPDRFEGTLLDKLLPVENEPAPPLTVADELARTIKTGFRPVVTPEGGSYAALRFSADPGENADLWATCEPLLWSHPVRRLKSGASALLVHPDKKIGDQGVPILSVQRYGKGSVAYFATDETWRWRHLPGAAQHRRLWGQMVSALGMPHLLGHISRVQLETDRTEYAVGDKAQVLARILDADFNPLLADTVVATVERDLSSEKVVLSARRDQPGVFTGEWSPAAVGRYRMAVTTADGASDDRQLDVVEARLEQDDSGMREDLLRQIAKASGGTYLPLSDLAQVATLIKARPNQGGLKHEEITLWNAPGVLVLLVLFLGLEWFYRKRWDML